MMKQLFTKKRVLAVVLSAAMIATQSVAAFADPVDAPVTDAAAAVVEEADAEPLQGDEAESTQMAEESAADEDGESEESIEAAAGESEESIEAAAGEAEESVEAAAGEVTDEAGSDEASEEEIASEGAFNGTPSKVIGLDVSSFSYYGTLYDEANTPYTYVYREKPIEVAGEEESFRDKATTLYTYGGNYYDDISYDADKKKVTFYNSDRVDIVGTYDSNEAANTARNGFAKKDKDETVLYYQVGAKLYKNLSRKNNSETRKYYLYGRPISLTARYPRITWTSLSTDHVYSYNGELIRIGYQVEENGKIISDSYTTKDEKYKFTTNTSISGAVSLEAGQSATYRVRGVYYIQVEKKNEQGEPDGYDYTVFKEGEWSEPLTATFAALKKMPAVSGLQMKQDVKYGIDDEDDAYVKFSWNPDPAIDSYRIYYLRSNEPLTGLTDLRKLYTNYEEMQTFRTAHPGVSTVDYITSSGKSTNRYIGVKGAHYETGEELTYQYVYAQICANDMYDDSLYDSREPALSAVISAKLTVQEDTAPYLPTLENFHAEYDVDGVFQRLAWNPTQKDTKVYLFALEDGKEPLWYQYRAYHNDSDMIDGLTEVQRHEIDRFTSYGSTDSHAGYRGTYSSFRFIPGKTYKIVAYTVDSRSFGTPKAPLTIGKNTFTEYNDVKQAGVTTVKTNLDTPSVTTESSKTSVKLVMSNYGMSTGFEIYKKSGKKFKKLTTTTRNVFEDTDLKADKKYQYKVRGYYYNPDTREKAYSAYTIVNAETSEVNNILLKAQLKSKNSVALSWTKLKGATKYEVYRCESTSGDPLTVSFKNRTEIEKSSPKTALFNANYTLIKTLKGNKMTDKKLTAGCGYSYYVLAYFKNNGKTEYISAYTGVYLKMQTPKVSKIAGSTITWEKDKFAKQYEVIVRVYDENDKMTTDEPVLARVSKPSYSVGKIPAGGHAQISIRCLNGNNVSEWTGTYTLYPVTMKAPTGIKAVNTTVKLKSGATVQAVKISWKAVSGAKYYQVYRSTKQGKYDADTKAYALPGEATLISKEGNDDESYDSVEYDEYMGINGSVVGTSVVDRYRMDPGVTYFYYVVACGERLSGVSSTMSVVDESQASGRPAQIIYGGPSISKVTKAKKKSVSFTWDKTAGAKKYTIYRSKKEGTGYVKIGTTKKNSFTDKKAPKGTFYYKIVVSSGTNKLLGSFDSDLDTAPSTKIKVK